MSRNLKLATLKAWIARDPEGRKRLTKAFQPVRVDQKEKRRADHENHLRKIGRI
jgi:hypothetical protein